MIPKIIHYCWFGGKEIPQKMQNYISGWKEICPDYEVICWNEENFNVNINSFVKKSYEMGKYAFVADYTRLWAVYNYGGFYLDTDVELLKTLDGLRNSKAVFGCEGVDYVNTGVGFGAVSQCELIRKNMEVYEKLEDSEQILNVNPCPYYTTQILKENGFVFPLRKVTSINGITVYPNEYFNPYDWTTDKIKVTKNTYSVHHYAASWMTVEQKRGAIEQHFYRKYQRIYGKKIADIWSWFYWNKKENGGVGRIKAVMKKVREKVKHDARL